MLKSDPTKDRPRARSLRPGVGGLLVASALFLFATFVLIALVRGPKSGARGGDESDAQNKSQANEGTKEETEQDLASLRRSTGQVSRRPAAFPDELPEQVSRSDGPTPALPRQKSAPSSPAPATPVEQPQGKTQDRPPAEANKVAVKRLHQYDAEELRKELLQVPETGLDVVPNGSANLLALAAQCRQSGEAYLGPIALRSSRLDLACLPLQSGVDCVLGKEPAEDFQAMSRKLRATIEACISKDGGDPRPDPDRLREKLFQSDGGWLKPEAVRCMRQMLSAEHLQVRKVMLEVLAKITDRVATETLAMIAMTDLEAEVRMSAIRALQNRPRAEFLPLLVGGLSYPWTGVVAHAAEALMALEGKDAAPALVRALKEPDPNLPIPWQLGKQKFYVVRELVRVNHLANCLLCHAPSFDRTDLVRGAVPIPGQPLPGPATTPQYYESGESFVRADITYLRQHFSVVQPVPHAGVWPANQRFDYLVRLRPLMNKKELHAAEVLKGRPITPQKNVLLRAIRDATGRDPGATREEWGRFEIEDRNAEPWRDDQEKRIAKEWGQFLPVRHAEMAGNK